MMIKALHASLIADLEELTPHHEGSLSETVLEILEKSLDTWEDH